MDLQLRLVTRAEAERVIRRRHDPGDLSWADGYPLDGDSRACASYVSHLPPGAGPHSTSRFGYYQIVEDGIVIGGIGFHSPPLEGVVEVGYGVVPGARGRGVAKKALQMIIGIAESAGVTTVVGRTSDDNVASKRVMESAGMVQTGRDPDFLRFERHLAGAP
ncbi:MAG TPA: GNAT family N-acetyltransferase [Acidimicrobiales bacterium]|nr:GNAT family N-acetyltransferase [Acidimicrobiales bacterium]